MVISDLEAVNGVLRELGEQPLTTLDSSYPTADLAQVSLNTARLELLQRGWWFNTITGFKITPDGEGKAKVPDNALEFIPDDPSILWSGTYLMKGNGDSYFSPDRSISGTLKFSQPLQALPYAAQELIVLMAASKVYTSDFGPDSKYQEIMLRSRDLFNVLSAQHIRAKRPSMRNRPAVRAYYNSLLT